MPKTKLTADELRSIEEGDYLVGELASDEYWHGFEGRVSYVEEYSTGRVVIGLSNRGYTSRLVVPTDAREGLRFTGAARGATDLRVDAVYLKERVVA